MKAVNHDFGMGQFLRNRLAVRLPQVNTDRLNGGSLFGGQLMDPFFERGLATIFEYRQDPTLFRHRKDQDKITMPSFRAISSMPKIRKGGRC